MFTDLKIRQYIRDDFDMVADWWRTHHGNDFRPGYVPSAAFIIETEGQATAFFGVCPMTPDFAYLAFPLVNPALDKESREKSLDFVVEAAKVWIKHAGIPILWISIRGESFLNRLRKKGFVAGEDGCQHMFYKGGEIK